MLFPMEKHRSSSTFGFIVGILTAASLGGTALAIAGYKLADRSYVVKIEQPADGSLRPRVIVMPYENRYLPTPASQLHQPLAPSMVRSSSSSCRYRVPGRPAQECLKITRGVYNEAWLKCRDGYYIN